MLSNKSHYALRAALELALRHGRGPVTINDIAAAQNIPARFLEAILRELRQTGLCESVRGKEGGYILAREPALISVGEIIRLFEGPLVASPDAGGNGPESGQIFKPIWTQAEQALSDIFNSYTLARLAELEQQRAFEKAHNYSI